MERHTTIGENSWKYRNIHVLNTQNSFKFNVTHVQEQIDTGKFIRLSVGKILSSYILTNIGCEINSYRYLVNNTPILSNDV